MSIAGYAMGWKLGLVLGLQEEEGLGQGQWCLVVSGLESVQLLEMVTARELVLW